MRCLPKLHTAFLVQSLPAGTSDTRSTTDWRHSP
jgi:hypothetical protein